ncbi:hypothetical protein [Streptomyces sp. CBMA156]|uniref:hypothetical protein n=1 Tax=Streptomyces sp. CBMA156 TaxID=1930280 RepID=UPI001661EE69|nr:hypothetical protein [Streptomyces sp. CBMA156]MBD0670799.1 hypothetical protein [Streptomyces sp. CBMA156]MBD0674394.1 hypothetical protein [Streptomyces sp. CBMA156]
MPECAELRPVAVPPVVAAQPVAVLPLWRRGEAGERRTADRPGVLRGHPGPVTAARYGSEGGEGAEPEG